VGYSFAAGTTDGPGAEGFSQGDTLADHGGDVKKKKKKRRVLGAVASWALSGFKRWGVPREAREAHYPKPVLLHFGDTVFVAGPGVDVGEDVAEDVGEDVVERGEGVGESSAASWVAVDVPVQMFRIGRLLVAAVPAEATTMAGRRLTERILAAAAAASESAVTDWEVIITGLANGYSGYVTTAEEYAAQRYEGASTLYGPHTLGAYMQALDALTTDLVQKSQTTTQTETQTHSQPHQLPRTQRREPGPHPRWGLQSAVPPMDMRWPLWKKNCKRDYKETAFGDCLRDVEEEEEEEEELPAEEGDERERERKGTRENNKKKKVSSYGGATVVAGAAGGAGEAKGVFLAVGDCTSCESS
jgi:hypothetical protein